MGTGVEEEIKEKYSNAKNRLVLLDYDGTLVNYVSMPEKAVLPGYIFDILYDLNDSPKNRIFIITGRAHSDIDRLLNHFPISIIAEHGAWIKEGESWKRQIVDNISWKKPIIPILNEFTAKCPGSYIEEKIFSVTWHYRSADPAVGHSRSRELIEMLKNVSMAYNLKVLDGKKVVDILTGESGKGSAVKRLVEQNSYDFVLSIGDDATDEEMFSYLLHISNAVTIKVGEGATYARYKFSSINDVVILLKSLLT